MTQKVILESRRAIGTHCREDQDSLAPSIVIRYKLECGHFGEYADTGWGLGEFNCLECEGRNNPSMFSGDNRFKPYSCDNCYSWKPADGVSEIKPDDNFCKNCSSALHRYDCEKQCPLCFGELIEIESYPAIIDPKIGQIVGWDYDKPKIKLPQCSKCKRVFI